MTSRPRAPIIAVALLLALGAPAGAAAAEAPDNEVARALHVATRYADLLRESIAALEHNPDAATIWAALYDARRIVSEIDRVSANAVILKASPRDRQRLRDMAAEAHLNLALFETHGLDFDRARTEVTRARGLSDHIAHADFRTPWVALQTAQPGQALVTHYKLMTVPEFEAALGATWHRVRQVRFEFIGFNTQELLRMNLKRADAPEAGSLEDRLLSRAAGRIQEALEDGEAAFTLPLPPGLYRVKVGSNESFSRNFIVPEVTEVDRVVLDRAQFELSVDPKPGPKGPWFFLNGIEVTELASMPYGVYRVKADPKEFPNAPLVVEFILGEGIPDKTRSVWTVYVPPGGSYHLRMGKRRR